MAAKDRHGFSQICPKKLEGTVLLIYLSVLETDHEKHEFMALYAEYHAVMLRVAKKYFPTDQMAREDAVQNAWMKIVKIFKKFLRSNARKEEPIAL